MSSTTSPTKAAEALLARHAPNSAPVDVEAIARAEGIVLARERLDRSVSGLLLREEGACLIAVNDTHHPRRQRFTVAHELGHWMLHPGEKYLVDSTMRVNFRDDLASKASSRQEVAANAFAAALLMPERLVCDAVGELAAAQAGNAERAVEELASRFDVSVEAMGYRLIHLGLAT